MSFESPTGPRRRSPLRISSQGETNPIQERAYFQEISRGYTPIGALNINTAKEFQDESVLQKKYPLSMNPSKNPFLNGYY